MILRTPHSLSTLLLAAVALVGASAPVPTRRAPVVVAPATGAIVGDLATWDGSTHDERVAAAREIAAFARGFVFDRIEMFGDGAARREVAVFVYEATGAEFSLVPAGSFTQGSVPDPVWTGDPRSPGPPHQVTLTEPFLIARIAVTQRDFRNVMGANPSRFLGDALPVDSVTWGEAVEYCRRTGLTLPTETNWERACRAGTTGRYSFDAESSSLDAHAWTSANSGDTTHDVASLEPNGFGLFDVHGNVWEWMADSLAPYPGADALGIRARALAAGWRVVRGGAWSHEPDRAESSARCGAPEDERLEYFGFRPVGVIKLPVGPRG